MNTETESPQLAVPTSDRRKGKIARLPKTVRDRINTMIQDGVPYLKIIESLGPDGAGLNEPNLSNWKDGGYRDWLREERLMTALEKKYELAKSIVTTADDHNDSGQAILQAIAINLAEFLAEMDPETMRQDLLHDADKFTRFVNSMVRLADGGIKCVRHKFAADDRLAEIQKRNAPAEGKGISEASLKRAEEKLNLL